MKRSSNSIKQNDKWWVNDLPKVTPIVSIILGCRQCSVRLSNSIREERNQISHPEPFNLCGNCINLVVEFEKIPEPEIIEITPQPKLIEPKVEVIKKVEKINHITKVYSYDGDYGFVKGIVVGVFGIAILATIFLLIFN